MSLLRLELSTGRSRNHIGSCMWWLRDKQWTTSTDGQSQPSTLNFVTEVRRVKSLEHMGHLSYPMPLIICAALRFFNKRAMPRSVLVCDLKRRGSPIIASACAIGLAQPLALRPQCRYGKILSMVLGSPQPPLSHLSLKTVSEIIRSPMALS